jgi:hypothetical protein
MTWIKSVKRKLSDSVKLRHVVNSVMMIVRSGNLHSIVFIPNALFLQLSALIIILGHSKVSLRKLYQIEFHRLHCSPGLHMLSAGANTSNIQPTG